MESSETPYRGEQGDVYLAQRNAAASDHNRYVRAGLFRDLSGPDRTMLDFGCSTGGVLARLSGRRKVGIEVGETPARQARQQGVEAFTDLGEVPDDSVSVAISFHAMENVRRPTEVLQETARVVKPCGSIRMIVPGELPTNPKQRRWYASADLHLHTWPPLLFGNLADRCGYRQIHTQIAPMPRGSRLVRALSWAPPLSRAAHWHLSRRRNVLNVLLDPRAPNKVGKR